jgi:hypothetical protein
MEILNEIPLTFINWEPLHVVKGVVPKEFNWGWRPYIIKDDKNKVNNDLIKKILSFKVHSEWTSRYLGRIEFKKIYNCKIVITKFVRANLLAPYIINNFHFHNKPILLIRHPIDVCISQIKAFDNNDTIKTSKFINNGRFIEHEGFIKTLKTKLEYKIATWCLNNCLLFKDKETLSKVNVVFYSDLLMNPEKETLKIFKTLHCISEVEAQKIIKSINFKKRSRTDFSNDLILDPMKQLNKNFGLLSRSEKDSIQNIFDYFEFDLFDAYAPFPKENIKASIDS